MSQEGLYFTHLDMENFKGIQKKIVEINGRSFLITAKNGIGKSSVIQAMLAGIDTKIQPTETITKGETKASAKIKVAGTLDGEYQEYTLEVYYTLKNQSGRVILLNTKGEQVKSPKEIIKSLFGNITFDIFKFLNSKKPEQIKILKQLSGVEPEINKLDMQRKKIFDDRTYKNRSVEEDEIEMKNHGFTPDEIKKYSEKKEVAPLQEEMDAVSRKLTTFNNVKIGTAEFKKKHKVTIPAEVKKVKTSIDEKKEKIKKLTEEIEAHAQELIALGTQADEAYEKRGKGLAWMRKNPEPNAKKISDALSDALLHNQNCEKVEALAAKQKNLIKDKQELERLNSEIDKIDKQKDKLIKNSKLPIKGLTFTEDNIFLDGLPLEQGQINTAKLIDVGVEISMALNPKLKTIFLHEGSLFDKESLKNLFQKAEERGYQIVAEIVSESGELEVKFKEDAFKTPGEEMEDEINKLKKNA